MSRRATSGYQTFDEITGRLDEIIAAVRDKDTSLERSLDLFDEALSLGATAVELVDTTSFTPEEEARLQELAGGGGVSRGSAGGDEGGDGAATPAA